MSAAKEFLDLIKAYVGQAKPIVMPCKVIDVNGTHCTVQLTSSELQIKQTCRPQTTHNGFFFVLGVYI